MLRSRRCLLLLTPLLLPACSSGGGDGAPDPSSDGDGEQQGDGGATASFDPTGTWNFFREADACSGDEFAALPLQVTENGDGTFELALGEVGEVFRFAATLDGRVLTVSGSATAGDTTIEVLGDLDNEWTLAEDGNSLVGLLNVLRTDPTGTCELADRVQAFRADDTDRSPVAGEWLWQLETTSATGPCAGDEGTVEVLVVELLPRREDAFTVDLRWPDGDAFQVEAELVGDALVVRGSDSFQEAGSGSLAEALEVTGSDLLYDAAADRLEGTLAVTTSSDDECDVGTAVDGRRRDAYAPTSKSFHVFLEDAAGAQRIVAIDPDHPTERHVLDSELGAEDLQLAEDLEGFSGLSTRGELDPASGDVTGVRLDRLFYLRGQEVAYFELDVRRNLLEEVQLPARRTLIEEPEPSNLQVFSRPSSETTLVTLAIGDGFDHRLVAIDREGNVTHRLVGGGWTMLFDTLDPATGELRGVVARDGDGQLHLLTTEPAESGPIGSEPATFPTRAEDGSVYFFANTDELNLYRSDTEEVVFLADLAQGRVPVLTRAWGERLLAFAEDGNGFLLLYVADETTTSLFVSDSGASDAEPSGAEPVLLPGVDQIVWQYTTAQGERPVLRYDPSVLFFPVEMPGVVQGHDLARARHVAGTLYFPSRGPSAPPLAVLEDGSDWMELPPGTYWRGPVPTGALTIGAPAPATGVLRVDPAQDVLESFGGGAPFGPATTTLGSAPFSELPAPDSTLYEPVPGVGPRGLLSRGNDVLFFDAEVEGSLVEVSQSNGTNLPFR